MPDTLVDMTTGRFTPKQTAGQVYENCTGYGALRVAQLDQEGAELTRAGRRFFLAISASPTGIAPVQAIPTTAAQWTIWNTSQTDTLTFESLGMLLASGTAAAGVQVMACIFTAPAQTGLATGVTAATASGSLRTSAAAIKSGVTITTPSAPAWFLVAQSASANTAVLAVSAINNDVKGRIMVPPLSGLGLATLSGTGTSPLFIPVASWTEGAQDLE